MIITTTTIVRATVWLVYCVAHDHEGATVHNEQQDLGEGILARLSEEGHVMRQREFTIEVPR